MKRLIASILIMSILCSNTITIAFANGHNTDSQVEDVHQVYSPLYVSMVEMERQSIYHELEVQLEQQDALDLLPVFKEIVDRNIDATYYAKSTTYTKVYAPNGGIVEYGDVSFDIVVTHMDKEATNDLETTTESAGAIAASAALQAILSHPAVAFFGGVYGVISILKRVATKQLWDSVHDGTGCCYAIFVNEKGDARTITTLHHWSNAYYMLVPDSGSYAYVDYTLFDD